MSLTIRLFSHLIALPGFEPGFLAPKASVIDHYTTELQENLINSNRIIEILDLALVDNGRLTSLIDPVLLKLVSCEMQI